MKPDPSEVGFKEWAIVCDSIARGETSLLIRKGGIAEGRDGFRFRHQEFFLLPTHFHEQMAAVRLSPEAAALSFASTTQTDIIAISIYLEVESTIWIDNLKQMEALRSLHILQDAVLEQRFSYDNQEGLNVAFLRAYRLAIPWKFPFQKSYGGCRSWVTLPSRPCDLSLSAVLSEEQQAERREIIKGANAMEKLVSHDRRQL